MDRKIEPKKGIQKKHLLILLGLTVISVLAWLISSSFNTKRYNVDGEQLNIATVKMGEFDDYITVNGIVSPISTIYMDAYEGGRVKEKLIEEGAMVKQGDVILKLENRQLYEQILSSENNLALKQNDLRSTKLAFDMRQNQGEKELVNAAYELKRFKRNYEQNKELYEEGLIAKEEYLRAQEDFNLSEKQHDIIQKQVDNDKAMRNNSFKELDFDLARMRKTLSMVYERVDQLNVKAPADGQLGFLDAEIGQSISQGSRIGQINVLTDFKIEVSVDEHYIDRVRRGLIASIERDQVSYELKLRKVYPEVRDGKFKVDFVFQGEKMKQIRTGQSNQLKLQLGASNKALLLPKGKFFQSTGGQWIYVLNEAGDMAVRKEITIGKQNAVYYEVLDGLDDTDQVITSSYENFGEVNQIIIE